MGEKLSNTQAPKAGTVLPALTVQGEKKTSAKRANGGGIR